MKEDKYYIELEKKGYYETIDKRSKDYREYKEWRATQIEITKKDYTTLKENIEKQPKGLGDTVASVTKATGVDKVVKFLAGEDCGCDERRDKWNDIFKYKTVKCVTEKDYIFLINFFNTYRGKVDFNEKQRLVDIYNYVFSYNENRNTSCSSCISKIVKNLQRYLSVYK